MSGTRTPLGGCGRSARAIPIASASAALLLDTTVLIDALRGRPAAERLRAMGRTSSPVPLVCAVNVEELVRGLRAGEERSLERLLDGLRMAPLGRPEGELAGSWRRSYATMGITLSQSDCLVGAVAAGLGARLATGNPKHFPMPELLVDHWPVGE